MQREQITLIKETWEPLRDEPEEAAALFYQRLFELDPKLRPMFKGDLKAQGKKLMTMLNAAINSMDRPDELRPVLLALGARHVSYHVEERHYDTVGQALLWMLGQRLGTGFTQAAEGAWLSLYTMVAQTMIEGARGIGVARSAAAT